MLPRNFPILGEACDLLRGSHWHGLCYREVAGNVFGFHSIATCRGGLEKPCDKLATSPFVPGKSATSVTRLGEVIDVTDKSTGMSYEFVAMSRGSRHSGIWALFVRLYYGSWGTIGFQVRWNLCVVWLLGLGWFHNSYTCIQNSIAVGDSFICFIVPMILFIYWSVMLSGLGHTSPVFY